MRGEHYGEILAPSGKSVGPSDFFSDFFGDKVGVFQLYFREFASLPNYLR